MAHSKLVSPHHGSSTSLTCPPLTSVAKWHCGPFSRGPPTLLEPWQAQSPAAAASEKSRPGVEGKGLQRPSPDLPVGPLLEGPLRTTCPFSFQWSLRAGGWNSDVAFSGRMLVCGRPYLPSRLGDSGCSPLWWGLRGLSWRWTNKAPPSCRLNTMQMIPQW